MHHRQLSFFVAVLAWTAAMFRVSNSDVYTSSRKISDMVLLEEQILNNLQTAVTDLGNQTASSFFSRFYQDRMWKVKERRMDAGLLRLLKHPNGIYHHIKQFATEYQNIRSVLESAESSSVQKYLSSIADQRDIIGARLSVLRLQRFYNLNPSDMVKGNYLGFAGPELSDKDILEIGKAAFEEGRLDDAITWLQEAQAIKSRNVPSAGFDTIIGTAPLAGRILALIGRSYIRQENHEKAAEMYTLAYSSDPTTGDVTELAHELKSKPETRRPRVENATYKRLCSIQNKLAQSKFDRRLNCSYRDVILPYYRFKQELVSISPYVALFYDVISDNEGENIIDVAKEKLERGGFLVKTSAEVRESRTSDVAWLEDADLPAAHRLSKKIAAITNLITTSESGSYVPNEPFQVVNYGMGGHYDTHYDPFDNETLERQKNDRLFKHGGNRLATFLIYLSDVERGGSTVFPTVDISVSPVKNMALFWYNYKPSGQLDLDTLHAGCPVVIGHKWVTNKWTWLHGNTFTRRCGLTENATQLDIDQYMRRGWA